MAQTRQPAPPAKSAKAPSKPEKPEKAVAKPDPKPDSKPIAKLATKVQESHDKHEKKADDKNDKKPKVEAKPEVKPSVKVAAAPEKGDKKGLKDEPMTMPRIASAKSVDAAAEPEEKPTPTTNMTKPQLKRFRVLLEEKRDDIIKKAKQTLDEDMTLDANDLPDEMDLASSEYLQSFTFRLRGREKTFLDKITKALERIDDGTFGVCEECGDDISVKRLEARPETTLCIRCKEDQERAEKDFG